tara:strand:- start:2093 stop:2689 length:597 start_codon:yes stop_codon:yes gene_type:complete
MGQRKTLTLLSLLLLPLFAAAQSEGELGVLLEPSFAAPKIAHPVNGAKSTVLVPALNTKYGLDRYTEEEWNAQKLGWPDVFPKAMKLADSLAKKIEPRWVRDRRGVILYGVIEDRDPFVSSVIFSEALHERMKSVLGKEFLALVPDRNIIFLFPKFGGNLEDYSVSIVEQYRRAPIKVSLEIFEISGNGCKVVGALGQ